MSSDEIFLEKLAMALEACGLEAIVVGGTAAMLHGAPVMTQDVDLLIRDTPRNAQKLSKFIQMLGAEALVPISDFTTTKRVIGSDVDIDFLFDTLGHRLKFASVRSRAVKKKIAKHALTVIAIEDLIFLKKKIARPKDLVHAELLEKVLVLKDSGVKARK